MSLSAASWSSTVWKGRRLDVFEPAVPSPHGWCVLYLHDRDGRSPADGGVLPTLLERHGLRCLAPNGGPCWWTDRIWPDFAANVSAERYLADHALQWLREHWHVEPPRIALLGVGMGGQAALKLAYKHPNQFPVVAAIAPAIDYHRALEAGDPVLRRLYRDGEQARQDTATLHIHPLNWPRNQWFCSDPADPLWFDGADRLRMKLWSLGVPHECDLETTTGGDAETYGQRMLEPAVKFLVERLEAERKRMA
jgi:S-formylglutathione hydrolase